MKNDQEEYMINLDKKITQIQKSTKTLLPFILPLHEQLRMRYAWYYRWHINPYSKIVHFFSLFLSIILGLTIFATTLTVAPQTVKASTGYVDPDGDGATLQWTPTPGPTHYTAIDEGTRQPDAPTLTDYILHAALGGPYTDQFSMSTIADAASVSSVVVWAYGKYVGAAAPRTYADIYMNGGWVGQQDLGFSTTSGWHSVTFNGTWTQADLGAMQISLQVEAAANGSSTVYSMYAAVTYVAAAATLDQKHFRVYSDDAGLNAATALANEDTNYSNAPIGTNVRVRFETANTGTAASNVTRRLEFNEGGGGWTQITTDSNNVRLSASAQFADGDATTTRLTATGTFTAGQGKDTGSDTTQISLTNAYYTEDEYSIAFQSGAAGLSYQFHITNAGVALNTYTATPTITVVSVPTAPTIAAATALSTSSIQWNFQDNASNEDGFKVYDTANTLKVTCATPNLTHCDETGLDTNTQYTRYVVAYNTAGNSTASATATLYTLAAVPSAPTLSAVSSSAINVIINQNGNPSSNTSYVDPNGDGATLEWTPTPGGTHYTAIDEGTRYNNTPDTADYIQSGPADKTDEFDMTTISNASSVSQIVIWIYGYTFGLDPPNIAGNIYVDGGWQVAQNFNPDVAASWKSVTFSGTWTQTDINNLQVRLSTVNGSAGQSYIYAMYAAVTFTGATQYAIYNDTLSKYVGADGVADEAAEVWQSYDAWGGLSGINNTGLSSSTEYTYKVKAKNGDGTATALGTGASETTLGTASFNQEHFRIFQDDAGLNAATAYAAEDTNYSNAPIGTNIRVRLETANTGSDAGNIIRRLEFKEGVGGWTQITTDSNNVRLSASAQFVDGAATTTRLTPVGTFMAGQGKDTGSDTSSISLTNVYYTEDEYSIAFQSGAAGLSYQFRITNAGVALGAYTNTPTITAVSVPAAPTVFSGSVTTVTQTDRIVWSWTDNATNEDGYRLEDAAHTSMVGNLPAGTNTTTETSLTANTQYNRHANAYNTAGGADSNSDTKYTRIESAADATFSSIGTDTITIASSTSLTNLTSGSSAVKFTNSTAGTNSGWLTTNSWASGTLSPNTQYSFTIQTKNGDGIENTATGAFTKYTLANVPDAPTVAAASTSILSVTINENSNPAATTFSIKVGSQYVQADGTLGVGAVYQTKTVWGTPVSVTGLSVNTQYVVSTDAKNGDGTATDYSSTTSKYTLAAVPAAPTVAAVSSSSINVIINLNGNPTGTTTFAIYNDTLSKYVGADGVADEDAEVWQTYAVWGGLSGINNSGLSANTQYTYKTKAKNGDNAATALSSGAAKYTLTGTPGATTVAGGYDTTNGYKSAVSWSAPAGGVDHYHAYSSSDSYASIKYDGALTSYTETSLSANTAYIYRTYGINADGAASASYSEGTDTTPPAAPTDLVASNVTNSTATVSWTAAAGASTYTLSYGTDTDATNILVISGINTTSYDLNSLASETKHYYKVSATNANGTGAYSSIADFTTTGLPTAPTNFSGSVAGVTSNLTDRITWTWTDNATNENGYQLQNASHTSMVGNLPVNTTSVTETGLTANSQYNRHANVYNNAGSADSNSDSKYTRIESAGGANYSSVSTSSITIASSTSLTNLTTGSSAVKFSNTTTGANSGWITTNSWRSSSLSPNTQYNFIIITRNAEGVENNATGPFTKYTLPNAPTGASANGGYDTTNGYKEDVNWSAPTSGGANHYHVRSSADNYGSIIFDGSATSFTHSSLSANTLYRYRIYSVAADNTESTSYASASDRTPPAAPTGLSTSNITDVSARASWGSVSGASSYNLSYGTDADATNIRVITGINSRNYTLTGLTANTRYYFKVSTTNTNGTGAYSLIANFITTTLPAAPSNFYGTLSGVSATSTDRIIWRWTDNANNELGYRLEDSAHRSMVGNLPANTTTRTETGLSANNQYNRHANVYNNAGSADSNSDSKYTRIQSPSSAILSNPTTSSISISTGVNLTNLSQGNSGVIFTNQTKGINSGWLKNNLWTSYGLNPNTRYQFYINSRNGDGVENSNRGPFYGYTLPDPPGAVSATASYDSSRSYYVSLVWIAPSTGANHYHVYSSADGFRTVRYNGTSLAFIETNLDPGTTYTYRVYSVNAANQESMSYSQGSATTPLYPPEISPIRSTVVASPTTLIIGQTSRITITIRDFAGRPVSGRQIILSSSRGSQDIIYQPYQLTSSSGVTYGFITSNIAGKTIVVAYDETDDVYLDQKPVITFNNPSDIPGQNPVAIITAPNWALRGQEVTFDATKSYDDGQIVKHTWNLADGTRPPASYLPIVKHTYTITGRYAVSLIVQDDTGRQGSTSFVIDILPQPPVIKKVDINGKDIIFSGTASDTGVMALYIASDPKVVYISVNSVGNWQYNFIGGVDQLGDGKHTSWGVITDSHNMQSPSSEEKTFYLGMNPISILIDKEKERILSAPPSLFEKALVAVLGQFFPKAAVTEVIRAIKASLPAINFVLKPLAIVIPLMSIAMTAGLWNVPWYLYYLFNLALERIGLRKKREPWGVVYDAVSKAPIPIAVVRIFSYPKRKLLETRITDNEGRFGFSVPSGNYYVNVTKPGFTFASQLISVKAQRDDVYTNLYHGAVLACQKDGTIINVNIPIDPPKVEMATFYKKSATNLYLGTRAFINNITLPLLIVAAFTSTLSLLFFFEPYTPIFLVIYIILIVYEIIDRRKKVTWGVVYDFSSKKPLAGSVVKIYDAKYKKLKEARVTNKMGQFSFIVPPGEYYLEVNKPGYRIPENLIVKNDGQYHHLYTKGMITTTKQKPIVLANIPLQPEAEYDILPQK